MTAQNTQVNATAQKKSLMQMAHGTKLDLSKVPDLVGEGPRALANEVLEILENTSINPLLIGDSGTGKSAILKAVAKKYSERETKRRRAEKLIGDNEFVPAYYVQLSRDETKTSLFMGPRLIEGTLKTVDGMIAFAARQKAIVIVDEIGHGTHSILTLFNALDGKDSIISVGERTIPADGLKIMYGSNGANHAGNVKIPQSFANRVLSIPVNYPEMEDEFLVTKSVSNKTYKDGTARIDVPDPVIRYIVSFIRESRKPGIFPLSARNASAAVVLCQLAFNAYMSIDPKNRTEYSKMRVAEHFTSNNNLEALRRLITRRILNREASDVATLQKQEIIDFMIFVSQIGVDRFRTNLLRAVNFYADVEGLEIFDDIKTTIANSVI